MTKALITGASGFVGKTLCTFLQDKDIQTVKTLRTPSSKNNSEEIIIEGINSQTNWAGAFGGIDQIFHLAAHVHQTGQLDEESKKQFYEVNFEGTKHLATEAAKQGVNHFIFLSSSKVYGETSQSHGPFKETDPCRPEDDYGKSKLMAEEALAELSNHYDMKISIVRIPLVFGEAVKANFLSLIKMSDKLPFLPFGNLKNKRDMIYLENLVHGLHRISERNGNILACYNLSDGTSYIMSDFINILCQQLGHSNKNLTVPLALIELFSLMPIIGKKLNKITKDAEIDTSLIKGELNWSAPYGVESALSKTTAWFRSNQAK